MSRALWLNSIAWLSGEVPPGGGGGGGVVGRGLFDYKRILTKENHIIFFLTFRINN